MLEFSDGIRHLYQPKLNEASHDCNETINSWLASANDYLVTHNQIVNDFTITTFDPLDFISPYAFDINRLSCASLESINDIDKSTKLPKFLGWNLTKLYYSAFFSAHSILKVTGNSLSNIDSKALEAVKQVTRSYGFTYGNLNSGLYCISLDLRNNSYRFYKDQRYDASHEGLWKRFLDFININQVSIYSHLPQQDAQLIIDKLDELKAALCNWNSQNGNWLSRIRNTINYSHSHGVWFPYKEFIEEYNQIFSFLKLHKENPLNIDLKSFRGKEILYYVRCCQLINAINFDILSDLSKRHPKNKSFVLNGILKFRKLYDNR